MRVILWIPLCYVLLAHASVGTKLDEGEMQAEVEMHGGENEVEDGVESRRDQRCKGVPSTNWSCCSKARKCNFGEGDCDRDSDCAGSLKCGSDNCRKGFSSTGSNWSDAADCCTLVVGNVGTGKTRAPSRARYESAKAGLKKFLRLFPESGLLSGLRRLGLAGWVRLAFHDCVGPNGCDGCVNRNQDENAGLELVIITLEALRKGLLVPLLGKPHLDISIADWWQISGIASLEVARPSIDITFKGGRVDCATAPWDKAKHTFPTPDMNRKQMMKWFKKNTDGFSMNQNEVTALMGAHALGGASNIFSGFHGEWTPGNVNLFNNEYYQRLNDPSLTFTNKANRLAWRGRDRRYQWDVTDDTGSFLKRFKNKIKNLLGHGKSFFLNTDIELAYDIDVDNAGRGTRCVIGKNSPKNRWWDPWKAAREAAEAARRIAAEAARKAVEAARRAAEMARKAAAEVAKKLKKKEEAAAKKLKKIAEAARRIAEEARRKAEAAAKILFKDTYNNKNRCKEAPTKKLVAIYARDENRFIRDFKKVYEKMMTKKIRVRLTTPY